MPEGSRRVRALAAIDRIGEAVSHINDESAEASELYEALFELGNAVGIPADVHQTLHVLWSPEPSELIPRRQEDDDLDVPTFMKPPAEQ